MSYYPHLIYSAHNQGKLLWKAVSLKYRLFHVFLFQFSMYKEGKGIVPSTVSSELLPEVLMFKKFSCLNVPFLHPLKLRLIRIWMRAHQKKVVSSGLYLSFTCLISNHRHPGASCLAVWVSCLPVQMSEVSWCICNGSGCLRLHSHSCSLDVFSCWTGAYLSGDEQPCCSTGNGMKIYDMSDVCQLYVFRKFPLALGLWEVSPNV